MRSKKDNFPVMPSRVSFFPGCLNYFSCFLLVPFALKWNKMDSRYAIQSNLFRKIYYAMGIISVVIGTSLWTISHIAGVRQHPENLVTVFEIIMPPCVATLQAYVAYILFFQQARLASVLSRVRLLSNPISTMKLVVFCSVSLALMFINCIVLAQNEAIKQCMTKLVNWILCIFTDEYHVLGTNMTNPTVNSIVHLLYYSLSPWIILQCMPEVLGLSIALSLICLAQTFQLRLNMNLSVDEGYTLYKEYKTVINNMNALWGPTFLILYIADVIYYARAPYVIVTENPDVAFCIYLFANLMIWGTGAHFHKMMTSSIKQWIQMKQESDMSLESRLKLLGLAHEVDSEPLGISCTFFTLTYPFLGSMFGILATYALIIYQQQQTQ